MADTGRLQHDARLGGGALRLFREDGETKLVLAGPREDLPGQGVVAVYGEGKLLAKLFVTASDEGRLSLRVDDGAGGITETVVLEGGGEYPFRESKRRGRLILTEAEEGPEARGRIELGFNDDGPFLVLTKGQRTLKLSVDWGLQLPPELMIREVIPERQF